MVDALAVTREPLVPSISPASPIRGHTVEHNWGRSRTHSEHSPHDGVHDSATWSPGATRVTPGADCLDDACAFMPEHDGARRDSVVPSIAL